MRLVIVTLDHHLSEAFERARAALRREAPSLEMRLHAAADWAADPSAAERCRLDIAGADVVLVTQIFLEEQAAEILPALAARRGHCAAIACALCAPDVMRMTRMGRFSMDTSGDGDGSSFSLAGLLKRMRGNRASASGQAQMKQLRRIPRLLRFVPGTAQDVRAWFLVMQYWLGGSEANLASLVRFLVQRYAPDQTLRAAMHPAPPVEYPDTGVYHPALPGTRIAADVAALAKLGPSKADARGTVGVLVMRSYLLAGNTAHYDAVIRALEAKGLRVIAAFASGLDARPAAERFFRGRDGRPCIDALVSLTGFSLVGGPAFHDGDGARALLAGLDVPYVAAQPLELQSVDEWRDNPRGLTPLQSTLMVALPELDGATGPIVYAGRQGGTGDTQPLPERVERLAARVERWVALRATPKRERKIGIVLFNFPPNAGNTGTAAYLAVFESLHHTLAALKADGYAVDVPATADALRDRIVRGNAEMLGAAANVHARIPADTHLRRETWLREIERAWGPAPGRQNADGASIHVLGERFGNVFVGVQPAFGYEGDPMRLLFERGFAPTHAFSAFYRWLREDFGASALLHFGTHGALEFMPGKQVGMSAECWPDRLIGDVPNVYLYASNNPSEGTLAKRRAAATLVSYLTPPVTHAGLYRGLLELKSALDRWRALPAGADDERASLATLVQAQAAALELADAEPAWSDADAQVVRLTERVLEMEYALIPHGLHVTGAGMDDDERIDTLAAVAESLIVSTDADAAAASPSPDALRGIAAATVRGSSAEDVFAAARAAGMPADKAHELARRLAEIDRHLRDDAEIPALLRALDGRFIAPAPGGDLLRNPAVLPTGRNVYGFDPFRVPSAFAVRDGRAQAERLLARHVADTGALPRTVAMVLWGTDNMKSEGGPIAQALALLGAEPRFDAYGRLAGATLIPLSTLGRPRIDVVLTLSGIFRDLLPLQTRLLAQAALLAAEADEPAEMNFVRAHTLAHAAALGCDVRAAALRVFSNADGAYGANVNLLVDSGRWNQEDELAETFLRRKSFAYGADASSHAAPELMARALATADLAYQNIESVELGVSDVDQYFDGLGGMSRAVRRARGGAVPAYLGDQTRGAGTVRTLSEQVSLEARTRFLNPKWYEGMLRHGYEGVRQIDARVTSALGWSATTGEVPNWVYGEVTRTYVLDREMRDRLARLNPAASARMAGRLLEASDRGYWRADDITLEALRNAADELEDRLEGIQPEAA
ncbi:MAG TPA: magnesium chelatase subunit H [Longimicrobium sp.]|nr:magnesium chelatase subunit H [Longimicrobium sp.]